MLIKDARKSKNLTQNQLAKNIGVSQSTVAQWERGITLPTAKNLLMLASVLGVTVDELLKEKE